jgi:hypothetical protein
MLWYGSVVNVFVPLKCAAPVRAAFSLIASGLMLIIGIGKRVRPLRHWALANGDETSERLRRVANSAAELDPLWPVTNPSPAAEGACAQAQ